MPRSAKRPVEDNDSQDGPTMPAPGGQCSDETKRSAYQEALILKIAAECAAEVAKSKMGAYRAYLKAAAKRGVSSKSITETLAVRFQDPDLVLIEERERLKMFELSGFLPGIRDRLLTRFDVQQPSRREEEENQALIAYDRGVLAGRQGHPQTVCDYPVGSLGHVKWLDGWRAGQQAIADEMRPEGSGAGVGEVDPPPRSEATGTLTIKAIGKRGRRKSGDPVPPHPRDAELPGVIPAAVH